MKTSLFLLIFTFLTTVTSHAQLKVIEPGQITFVNGEVVLSDAGMDDLSGTTILTEVDNLNSDNEYMVWVVNESELSYTTRIVRTELDVQDGTENNVTWHVGGPAAVDAGDVPVWVVGGSSAVFTETLAPGDTIRTFSLHHYPNEVIGCSHYRIDVVNEEDHAEILTTFEVIFDHSLESSCVTSVNDRAENTGMTIAPNPASDHLDLRIDGVDVPVEVRITDLLGQQVAKHRLVPMESQVERITTSELRRCLLPLHPR